MERRDEEGVSLSILSQSICWLLERESAPKTPCSSKKGVKWTCAGESRLLEDFGNSSEFNRKKYMYTEWCGVSIEMVVQIGKLIS